MSIVLIKVREFLLLWLLYFFGMAIVGVVAIYLFVPVIALLKTGEFKIPWSIEPLLLVGRGVTAASFVLSVVMFTWEHFRSRPNPDPGS